MKRNPWALTDAEAAARDAAILNQFLAAKRHAETVHSHDRRVVRALDRQFGNPAVREALLRAVNRKMAERAP